MCLAVPGKVVLIKDDRAIIDYAGETREAGTAFLPDIKEGEYVIVSAKMVMQRVPEEEAKKALALWDELDREDACDC